MIQVYCGAGKGKTTTAVGATVRAIGAGWRVLFVQFMKNGDTGELDVLRRLGVKVLLPEEKYDLFSRPSGETHAALCRCYNGLLDRVANEAEQYEMIVLDEANPTLAAGLLDADRLTALLRREGDRRELLLTGHGAAAEILELADYISEIQPLRHPFEKGVAARRGVEY